MCVCAHGTFTHLYFGCACLCGRVRMHAIMFLECIHMFVCVCVCVCVFGVCVCVCVCVGDERGVCVCVWMCESSHCRVNRLWRPQAGRLAAKRDGERERRTHTQPTHPPHTHTHHSTHES